MSRTKANSELNGFCDAPVEASGLPPRILSALRSAGITTLGDLRLAPLPFHRLDAEDRTLLKRVAGWYEQSTREQPEALNVHSWLRLFLPSRLSDALNLHFGLQEPAESIGLHEGPLRETGFKLGVSRERARQLLDLAFHALRQPLPLHAVEPVFQAAESELRSAGGVLDASTLAKRHHPTWKDASPVGVFMLLVRLRPDRIVLYRGFFSLLGDIEIDRVEKAMRDLLQPDRGLQPIADLSVQLPQPARPPRLPSAEPLLLALLRHMPDTLATRDGRAGILARDGIEVLCEVLADTGERPLRTLVDGFNRRVYPECRRGSGTIREMLDRDPRIRKTAPGRYALPGGLQSTLPLSP